MAVVCVLAADSGGGRAPCGQSARSRRSRVQAVVRVGRRALPAEALAREMDFQAQERERKLLGRLASFADLSLFDRAMLTVTAQLATDAEASPGACVCVCVYV